jgi:hypothetical protein
LDLIPKLKRIELMRALLQMTMETEDTTERLSAPTVLARTSPLPSHLHLVVATRQAELQIGDGYAVDRG